MGIKNWLADLFFPKYCCACGKEGLFLCSDCERSLRFKPGELKPAPKNIEQLLIAGDYEQRALKEAIKSLKFKLIKEIGPILGRFLIIHLSAYQIIIPNLNDNRLLVVPIPLPRKRLKRRGFNQAAEIASPLASALGCTYSESLQRKGNRRPQSSLSEADRKNNLTGAFFWTGEPLCGKNILLIDDVVTTGATLEAAAGVLKSAGAGKIYALAAAKG